MPDSESEIKHLLHERHTILPGNPEILWSAIPRKLRILRHCYRHS